MDDTTTDFPDFFCGSPLWFPDDDYPLFRTTPPLHESRTPALAHTDGFHCFARGKSDKQNFGHEERGPCSNYQDSMTMTSARTKRAWTFPDQQPKLSPLVLTPKDFDCLLSGTEMGEPDIPAATKKSIVPFRSLLGLRLDRSAFDSVLTPHVERHSGPENETDGTNPSRTSSRKRKRPDRFFCHERGVVKNTPDGMLDSAFGSSRSRKRESPLSPSTLLNCEPRADAVRRESSRRCLASKFLHQKEYVQALELRIHVLERQNQDLLRQLKQSCEDRF